MRNMVDIDVVIDEKFVDPKVTITTREKNKQVENIIYAIENVSDNDFPVICATGSNGLELYAKRIGQLSAFSQKLLAYFGNLCAFKLAINKYTIHRALSDCVACEEFLDETVHILVTAG